LTKELVEVERWLSEYTILEKRIDALYKQAKRPHLRDLALKLGPRGDKNMAVDTEQVRVSGGHQPLPWIVDFEMLYPKIAEVSEEISQEILACEHQLTDMRSVVRMAELTNEEQLYIEQRYFIGMSVRELEGEGYGRNKLADIKKSALEKIAAARKKEARKC
jgi:hypothetical protein